MRVATQAGGGNFMNYHDAVTAVLERAGRIILPGEPVDVVAAAEREFARHGACDARFLEPIERALRECLKQWTVVQKRAIWRSTGMDELDDLDFNASDTIWLDLRLGEELMHHITDRLSGKSPGDPKAEEGEEPG